MRVNVAVLVVSLITAAWCAHLCTALEVARLGNPIWRRADNLRDPAVLRLDDGYLLFYTRFSGSDWSQTNNWAVAVVFTRDFVTFENDHDITPKGYGSPGDPIRWHGRYLLPYQSYPNRPNRLCYSESTDGRTWPSARPRSFLPEANRLAWNTLKRAIDPCFVVDGDTLHCFFVGSCKISNGHANLLGHAVTTDKDLREWRILTTDAPLIGRGERAPDGVENITVFKTGQVWTMIYSEGMKNQHLAYAQSPDLVRWTLKGPIDVPRQTWMHRRYGAPFVWREPDQWVMILMGRGKDNRTTFGLLTSPDGIRWTLLPERAGK